MHLSPVLHTQHVSISTHKNVYTQTRQIKEWIIYLGVFYCTCANLPIEGQTYTLGEGTLAEPHSLTIWDFSVWIELCFYINSFGLVSFHVQYPVLCRPHCCSLNSLHSDKAAGLALKSQEAMLSVTWGPHGSTPESRH